VSSFKARKGVCLFFNHKEPIHAEINFLTLVHSIFYLVSFTLEIFPENELTVTLQTCHTLQSQNDCFGVIIRTLRVSRFPCVLSTVLHTDARKSIKSGDSFLFTFKK